MSSGALQTLARESSFTAQGFSACYFIFRKLLISRLSPVHGWPIKQIFQTRKALHHVAVHFEKQQRAPCSVHVLV